MQYCIGNALKRQIKKIYRAMVLDSTLNEDMIKKSGHLIRSCCKTVFDAADEMERCPKSEKKVPLIFEEIGDFCDFLSYDISEEELGSFFQELSDRRNLSYREIACLIPATQYCCLVAFADGRVKDQGLFLATLRTLQSFDGSEFADRFSKTEWVLQKDSVYPFLDQASKELYRNKILLGAGKKKLEERDVAVEALKQVRGNSAGKGHVGSLLLAQKNNKCYFPVLAGIAALLSLCTYYLVGPWIFLLSLIPIFITAKLICDTVFSRIVKPEILPKMKIKEDNCPKTLVTVVSMISDDRDVKKLLHRLDILAHRVPLKSIKVGLLLDFPKSDSPLSRSEQELLDSLEREIRQRNEKSNRFFCAVRKRMEIPGKYQFEAFGRKQGAMIDFSDLVFGKRNAFLVTIGDVADAVYMVTLDSDTEPMPGAVEKMIGFMEYPDHKPKVSHRKGAYSYVKSGYGIAAPRMESNPERSYSTPYASVLSGNSGTELYHNPHFNLYQDLFHEGIFCGKGILRIDLYREVIGNRYKNDPILSHDLPEGHFLRCANLSDVVFFDDIPDNVLADEKRTHRWIRGDAQNACYLSKRQNQSRLFSFQIFHNLCRALFPVFCFSLIALGAFRIEAVCVGLFWIIAPFLVKIPQIFSLMNNRNVVQPWRSIGIFCLETILQFLLLPTRAVNGFDGILRGAVRLITGKRKLEWTTAAKSMQKTGEVGDYFYHLRWQEIGFLLLFFPQVAIIGALWCVAPVIAYRISQPYRKQISDSPELKRDLASMWEYFADFMNQENHWLPPDNYQQEPLNVVAHRTSPTNIGLGLLCVLGAYDLSLISKEEMFERLERSLETVKTLPTWSGHLYNWYDTETLKVLPPRFISTVDSGNFAASLHALKKGLGSFPDQRAASICNDIDKILKETDFSKLYDKKKRLFPIGYDVLEERFSDSYYDLYASEARLTSYYAIMMGQVPLKHWTRLVRPAKRKKGKLVVSGWSGTMFEYFMPHIFLPAYRKTLSGEMLKGIFSEQVRYAGKDLPWGISESGYYAFDSLLNYQYRAFGLPSAALRRDVSFPKVVSPYSTFLAYPWFPDAAKQNKRELPRGKYGYYEAIDFRAGEDNPRIVQSFMAHHVAMSFLSGVNALTDKVMQKRFMDVEGEAYQSLLAECIPNCSHYRFSTSVKADASRRPAEVRIDRPDPEHPRACVLTNGTWTEILSDSGCGTVQYNGIDLVAPSYDVMNPEGIFLFVANKGKLFGTTYAPLFDDKPSYKMYFDGSGATCYGNFSEFETRMSVSLSPDLPACIRELSVKNNQMTESSFDFYLFLSPTLCSSGKYWAHPEYMDLFLTAEYDEPSHSVCFSRKGDSGVLWFAVSASEFYTFDVRRDTFGKYSELTAAKLCGDAEYPVFPALVIRGSLDIRGRGTETVRFAFSAGKTKEEAVSGVQRVLSQNFETLRKRYRQSLDAFFGGLQLRSADRLIFDYVSAKLLLPGIATAAKKKAANYLPGNTLWKYGISGDYPILTLRIGAESVPRILPFLKAVMCFCQANINVDLVILFRESPGYETPIQTAVSSLVRDCGVEAQKHIFPLNIRSVEEYLFFQKTSRLFINLERGWKITTPHRSFRPILSEGNGPASERILHATGRGGYLRDRGFLIEKRGRSQLRPWSLVLGNHRFGSVLNERSLGFTFAENASENRLTPRRKATSFQKGELLYAVMKGKKYDLLENAQAIFYPHKAVYKICLNGAEIQTEVFVPVRLPAKIIRITVVQDEKEVISDIVYDPRIILGKRDTGTVTRVLDEDKIFFTNAFQQSGCAVLFGNHVAPEGESLHFYPKNGSKTAEMILAYGKGKNAASSVAELLKKPKRIGKELQKAKQSAENLIQIETPDPDLNFFVNGFLQQQIRISRLAARTGPYQPGGAFGFRDQLQDALCLATFKSAPLKHQILRCCRHQFEEGDVLHWWHPRPKGKDDGIRTRFSDDPFWLVYACCEYYEKTQDLQFFDRKIPYLSAPPLNDEEADRYFTSDRSSLRESVYDHALRAFRYGYRRGRNGLILFGSGDWNDGMNRIGPGGETVWGSMFALLCAKRFIPLAKAENCGGDVAFLEECERELRSALERTAYDNDKYLRGFSGDGTPFGDGEAMDLIPQAFAAFCGLDHGDIALQTAYEKLWDPDSGIIRLLTPPYRANPGEFPGSIGEYPPGVRENGGQYTHAGVWFIKALLEHGKVAQGAEILRKINPVSRCKTPQDAAKYGGEPYVLSADVYTLPGREGTAGWSHYTGAAGWYLKTLTESLLGIKKTGDTVSITPNLPKDWNGYKAVVCVEEDLLKIQVLRGSETGIYEGGRKTETIVLNGSEREITVIIKP